MPAERSASPVNSFNEWDPLEEVIVGAVDGATVPPWHVTLKATVPKNQHRFLRQNAGRSFPIERIAGARRELEGLTRLLQGEGVKVRRPEPVDQTRPFGAPGWSSTGLYSAMPRDVLLVIGDEIIEAPMAWRCRYFETSCYRSLLKEYFLAGAKWSAGPKPELKDDLYDSDFIEPKIGKPMRYVISEREPTFDAADFVRCGRDLFGQRSNVTNQFGIDWLQRHLGDAYRLHVLEFRDTQPMHIDATILPLAPGKLLINPERVPKVPSVFRSWDVFRAPRPCVAQNHPLYMTSSWINMNVLMIDEKRVVVEKGDESMIRALRKWGFTPLPCSFRHFNSFGGSFHCATLDIRRRGTLQSYF